MFIQLLRNFNVEEGMDVNIVLMNVVEAAKGYTLKLIRFGDSDIFVVREGKFADMAKMVPENGSLYDLKFLEVELDKGDVLMLGNKTLLRNAFETDMLALTDVGSLLRSLEEFKENLFGSKKLFLVAATDLAEIPEETTKKMSISMDKVKAAASSGFSFFKNVATKVMDRIKKNKPTQPVESALSSQSTPIEDVLSEIPDEDHFVTNTDETEIKIHNATEPEVQIVDESKRGFINPPPVHSSEEVVSVDEYSDIDEEKPDEDAFLVDPVEPLPEKEVVVEDFAIAEEITPAMVVDKSEYNEIIDAATIDEEPVKDAPPVKSFIAAPTLPAKGMDYVNELRARHSPMGKVLRNPAVKTVKNFFSGIFTMLIASVMRLFGKTAVTPETKIFLARPTSLEKKKVQPGVILILAIVLLSLFFWSRAKIAQTKSEKSLLTEYQQQVSVFSTFFEQNISIIDAEDTERQLELCAPEAAKVYTKETALLPKVKTEKTKGEIKNLTSQVQAKVAECQSKFDKIYGIVRVKDAELVTDFKVSLGNDSDISAITFRGNAIVVADKGRKSVYQVNVDTKSVTKLEDPLGLVVDPIIVGTGEGTLFVCDKTNGVLYFSKNASGNQEGFNRIVGAEPSVIGECAYVDGFAKNAYVVPSTANVVYKIAAKTSGFDLPIKYMKDLLGVRSITIDNFIYVVSSIDGKGEIQRFLGGKLDSGFTMPQSADLGELTASYTNPSGERNLYVYDKTKHAILSIEKPNSKHPNRGLVEKTYQFDKSDDRFNNVKSVAIDLNSRNQEVNMYILSGETIWKITL